MAVVLHAIVTSTSNVAPLHMKLPTLFEVSIRTVASPSAEKLSGARSRAGTITVFTEHSESLPADN